MSDLVSMGGTIVAMSKSPLAENGLGYCFVIVKDAKGTEYSIQAFDKRAFALYEHAKNIGEQ